MSLVEVTESALEVRNMRVEFGDPGGDASVLAVDDVSFQVRRGEIVCLVGPSGCGKSTALNVVAGMLKPKPTAGIAVSGAVDINVAEGEPKHRRIGYMFQQDTLLPWMTAADNVALPLRLRGESEYRDQVLRLLELTGLSGFGARYPRELSGGMRKRIQMAQLLAQDPAILLMDEPFGALDAQTRALMQQEFLDVWERDRKTILFVTHDLSEAILLGDRILCMSARPGRIKSQTRVPFPRPRSHEEIVGERVYAELLSSLWADLRGEAGRALDGAQQP